MNKDYDDDHEHFETGKKVTILHKCIRMLIFNDKF